MPQTLLSRADELGLIFLPALCARMAERGRLNTGRGCAEHARCSCDYSNSLECNTDQPRGTRPADRIYRAEIRQVTNWGLEEQQKTDFPRPVAKPGMEFQILSVKLTTFPKFIANGHNRLTWV